MVSPNGTIHPFLMVSESQSTDRTLDVHPERVRAL